MKKEIRTFFTALMYFTRIRVPKSIDHDPVYLQKAPKYFPLIGCIVGTGCSFVYLVFTRFVSVEIGIFASMVAGLLITGAFHEDGFADVCDGFGGGWTKEKVLLIMKDSRIGAFGAIGLIAILGSKFMLLKQMALPYHIPYHDFFVSLIAAHSLSRLMPVLLIQYSVNVTDSEHNKSKSVTGIKLTPGEMLLAIGFALIPIIFLPWQLLLTIPPVLIATWRLHKYFKKWIGGYTGDCLGAIQQVSEIVFYLCFIFICNYGHLFGPPYHS